ncbi:MAG: FGGY family carbohydrate kinase [Galactobacter sp.]
MSNENPTTVGLDIGTTRTKAVLRDVGTGEALCSVFAPTPVLADPDNEDRRDPYQVLQTVTHLLHTLAMKRGDTRLSDVVGVSAACVGEELVYMGASGQALGSHRCWYAPGPGAPHAAERPHNEYASWYALGSDAERRLSQHANATAVTDLGSWVLMMLCDASQPVMDRSHASRTGLLDEDGRWSASRLASCGLALQQAPSMVDSGEIVGVVSESMSVITGLPVGVEVRAGGHDHLCAALASGARQPGDVFVSVGTSESQLMVLDAEFVDLVPCERPGLEFGYFTRPGLTYLHAAQPSGRRVSDLVAADPEGRSIQEVYAALDAAFPEGAASPQGEVANTDTTVSLLRSELQSQAMAAEDITTQLQEASGRRVHSKVVSGVPTQHRVWRQIRLNYGSDRIRFDRRDELSGLGAGLLACPPDYNDWDADGELVVPRQEGQS